MWKFVDFIQLRTGWASFLYSHWHWVKARVVGRIDKCLPSCSILATPMTQWTRNRRQITTHPPQSCSPFELWKLLSGFIGSSINCTRTPRDAGFFSAAIPYVVFWQKHLRAVAAIHNPVVVTVAHIEKQWQLGRVRINDVLWTSMQRVHLRMQYVFSQHRHACKPYAASTVVHFSKDRRQPS